MGAVAAWWRHRTLWQKFLLFLIVAGSAVFAFAITRESVEEVSTIMTISVPGVEPQPLTEGSDPAWSPDGELIAFTFDGENGDEIHTIDAGGSSSTFIVRGSDPAWSPDGSTLAFVVDDDAQGIYTMVLEGTDPVFLTEGANPAWSPDGSKLVFDRELARGRSWVHVIDLGTSMVTAITEGEDPAWSPDSSRFAFVRDDGDGPGIYVWDLDDGEEEHVARGDDPSWSLSGDLAFVVNGRDGLVVHTLEPNAAPVSLTDGERPSWSSDGRTIVFVRQS
jgi:Tol biopolymer transport system component